MADETSWSIKGLQVTTEETATFLHEASEDVIEDIIISVQSGSTANEVIEEIQSGA